MKKLYAFFILFLPFGTKNFAVPPGLTLNTNIRLNQVGFYPNCAKIGIVAGNPAAGNFTIRLNSDASIQYTGTLSASATWSFSNEIVRAADFSAFNIPGTYVMEVGGTCSFPFVIAENVFHEVNKASIKAYYMQRCSTPITAANAGVYARAEGHPDSNVIILPSAASALRPAGTSLSSPKGWYDAGDYNCYIVNSGISTYTLLATYEHFSAYFDTLNLTIPESGNAMPDILDEIKWNLDWMLTMQDPNDGGVYNKKTNAAFDNFIMPDAATTTRYFCAKGSAATFDFAAVMAVAYRIYKPFDLAYANQCLAAAQLAYTWGCANPNIGFNNPGASGIYPAVGTGGYGDGNLGDEKEWASNELYIATLNNATYYVNGYKNANGYGIPGWQNVNTLGLISLVHNRKKLNAAGFADTASMKSKLIGIASPLQAHQTGSAYKVAIGQGGANNDFVWGSNSQAANQGMILLTAYELNQDINYWIAALANLDYLLGRNATTYSFLTGYGSKPPMNPHHRPSESDGIIDPLPGWLVGGPQNQQNADGCGYLGTLPATKYLDNVCSYSTNEIAINWNAPFAFLSAAIQVLNPCSPIITLPVTLINFQAIPENETVSIKWGTSSEINNDYFLIERSYDGINFQRIGKVSAFSENKNIKNYSFLDQKPFDGTSYYRLSQHDINGEISYSPTITIYLNEGGIRIYPNPNNGSFTVDIDNPTSGSIVIQNLLGQKITGGIMDLTDGKKTFDIQHEKKGVYFITISQPNRVITKKIIIQ